MFIYFQSFKKNQQIDLSPLNVTTGRSLFSKTFILMVQELFLDLFVKIQDMSHFDVNKPFQLLPFYTQQYKIR